MKKIINFLVVVFLFSFSFNVYAESHDVVAKYNESQNIVTYEGTISNGSSTIKVDNGTFTIKTNSSDVNGVNLVIIKLSGDALNWIKNYTDSNDNYYLYFSKNELDVNITDKVAVTYDSFDNNEKQLVILNSNGDTVSKGNGNASAYKTNFYVSVSNIVKDVVSKKTLELDINSNGKVMIDGTMYEGVSKYSSNEDAVKVAIIPNSGYEVASIKLDDKDITSSLKNGFVIVDLKNSSKLSVDFSLIETENISEGYKISGKVLVDGKAISDAVVILNDDAKTVTNTSGEYHFDNVPEGVNSILIMKDGKGIGFATFKIVASDNNEFDAYEDDVFTIEMGQNNLTFVMDLNVNDDYSIDFSNVELDGNFNYMWLVVLGIVLVVGITVIIFIKKNKNDK